MIDFMVPSCVLPVYLGDSVFFFLYKNCITYLKEKRSLFFRTFAASTFLILCSTWQGMAFAHTKSNTEKYFVGTPCND